MNGPYPCDPEPVFELADDSLGPEREREVRAHLRDCRGCLDLYEKELRLNASLGSLDFEEPSSVCRGVAMALPTRSVRARLLWSGLAVVLLLTPGVGRFARYIGVVDEPGETRRVHTHPVPRLGGIALLLGIFVPALAFLELDGPYRGILLGAAIVYLVAKALIGWRRMALEHGATYRAAIVNGEPGVVYHWPDGRPAAVQELEIVDGLVVAVRTVLNPDKLAHLAAA